MSFSKKGENVNGAEDLHLTMAMEEVNLIKIIWKCTSILSVRYTVEPLIVATLGDPA